MSLDGTMSLMSECVALKRDDDTVAVDIAARSCAAVNVRPRADCDAEAANDDDDDDVVVVAIVDAVVVSRRMRDDSASAESSDGDEADALPCLLRLGDDVGDDDSDDKVEVEVAVESSDVGESTR